MKLHNSQGYAHYLGLDLAWSERNCTGAAVLDKNGNVLAYTAVLRRDDEILAWIRANMADNCIAGFDMPTIIRNQLGQRPAEAELRTAFGRYDAGPFPANLSRFPDGGRARKIIDALATDGFVESLPLAARQPGRYALEVYPHPAHIRLFNLDHVFRYKKKKRQWDDVCSEWKRYRAELASLKDADPPLLMPSSIPEAVMASGYKRWEDTLDAVTCAYVASYFGRWGTSAPHGRIFGDLANGYIAVPDRSPLNKP